MNQDSKGSEVLGEVTHQYKGYKIHRSNDYMDYVVNKEGSEHDCQYFDRLYHVKEAIDQELTTSHTK